MIRVRAWTLKQVFEGAVQKPGSADGKHHEERAPPQTLEHQEPRDRNNRETQNRCASQRGDVERGTQHPCGPDRMGEVGRIAQGEQDLTVKTLGFPFQNLARQLHEGDKQQQERYPADQKG